jgi:hypothetical protein
VDLLGTAIVLDTFEGVIAAGGAGVSIASIAGHLTHLPVEVEYALATTPTDELLGLPFLSAEAIATPMAQAELASTSGHAMRMMISASAARRQGTAEDVAAAADFLTGSHATFITGTDLLVDGGAVAAQLGGHVDRRYG